MVEVAQNRSADHAGMLVDDQHPAARHQRPLALAEQRRDIVDVVKGVEHEDGAKRSGGERQPPRIEDEMEIRVRQDRGNLAAQRRFRGLGRVTLGLSVPRKWRNWQTRRT